MPISYASVGALFADIQGFGTLNETQVETYTNVVMRRLADSVINQYRSDLVDLNTWGDAIFATSKDAVKLGRFALELRDFFIRLPGDTSYSDFQIRIALHFPRVYIAPNYVLSARGSKEGCFGKELTLPARIEPVTPPNTIFVTESFAREINDRPDCNMTAVRFDLPIHLPKNAGVVEVFSLHWRSEMPTPKIDWQDPLKELDAIAPMLVDTWFPRNERRYPKEPHHHKDRHTDVAGRLRECEEEETVCFISVTGRSIIFEKDPVPGDSIMDVSPVACAINKNARVKGIVLDRDSVEAKFRSKIEGNGILVRDSRLIEAIPNHDSWRSLKEKVRTNLLLKKTHVGLSFNLWLFKDRAIIEPYHFGKLDEDAHETHMCKFSQLTIFKERDKEYRMLSEHFKNLWKAAIPVWPGFQEPEAFQC